MKERNSADGKEENEAQREMLRIAFGLVYFGLCLGEFVQIHLAAFSSRTRHNNIHSSPEKAFVWLHYHDL